MQTMQLGRRVPFATTGRPRLAAAALRPAPPRHRQRQGGAGSAAAAALPPWQWPPQWPQMPWQQSIMADVRMAPQPCRAGAPASEGGIGSGGSSASPSRSPSPSSSSSTTSSSYSSAAAASAAGAGVSAAGGPVTRQRLREIHEQHRRPAGFKRLRVRGDGACMFRSVVQGDALLRNGALLDEPSEWEAAQRLRGDVVKQLAESRGDIEPFIPGIVEGLESFDGYLERMSRPSTWGGEPELAMATKVLGRPIAVYSPGAIPQHIITYGEETHKGEPPMHVMWSGNHYDLLIPTGGPRSKL